MPQSNLNEQLGSFIIPPLVSWFKQAQSEHSDLWKQIAELQRKLRKLDKQLTPAKRYYGAESTEVKTKIDRRRKTHDALKGLEWRMHALKKTLTSLNATFDSAIQPYARTSCHALISHLHRTCPREIRDQVYDYLLDDATVRSIGDRVRAQAAESRGKKRVERVFASAAPHFIDAAFAPEAVIGEIVYMAACRYSSKENGWLTLKDLERFVNGLCAEGRQLREEAGCKVVSTTAAHLDSSPPAWCFEDRVGSCGTSPLERGLLLGRDQASA